MMEDFEGGADPIRDITEFIKTMKEIERPKDDTVFLFMHQKGNKNLVLHQQHGPNIVILSDPGMVALEEWIKDNRDAINRMAAAIRKHPEEIEASLKDLHVRLNPGQITQRVDIASVQDITKLQKPVMGLGSGKLDTLPEPTRRDIIDKRKENRYRSHRHNY